MCTARAIELVLQPLFNVFSLRIVILPLLVSLGILLGIPHLLALLNIAQILMKLSMLPLVQFFAVFS